LCHEHLPHQILLQRGPHSPGNERGRKSDQRTTR
jgi:hypothetical protein